jgi:hypothetical protein
MFLYYSFSARATLSRFLADELTQRVVLESSWRRWRGSSVIYIKFCINPTIFYICCLYYANCYSKSMFTLINGLVKEE